MKIGFIGVGKLGLPVAETMASGGKFQSKHTIEGYDIKAFKSNLIKKVESIEEAIDQKEIIFIAVPTPHDPDYDGSRPTSHLPSKDFDYRIVAGVLEEVNKYATEDQCIVLISTCLPGTVRNQLAPLIQKSKLIYNPYFIAMGSVVEDFMDPEFFIIGTEDGVAEKIQPLLTFYSSLFHSKKHITTWDEAESVKIFYNCFISFKVGFVNMIQDVCEKMGSMNVDRITDALCDATDRLLSPAYMKAGMGDGGSCVLPSAQIEVNGRILTMEEFKRKFSDDGFYLTPSCNWSLETEDEKKVWKVIERDYDGELIELDLGDGTFVCTVDHLIPVLRDRSKILIRAGEIEEDDRLFRA